MKENLILAFESDYCLQKSKEMVKDRLHAKTIGFNNVFVFVVVVVSPRFNYFLKNVRLQYVNMIDQSKATK